MQLTYVDFPPNVKIFVGDESIINQNPFDEVASNYKAENLSDIKVKTDMYNLWIISDKEMRANGIN